MFLSAASAEFRPLREKLAVLLQRSGIDVEYQEIFPQSATDTVRKLGDLIAQAPLVVHVIGHQPGATANAAAVADAIAATGPGGLLARLPQLRDDLGDCAGITYTQWEALLALHHGVPLLVYATSDAVDPMTQAVSDAFPQRAHYERMRRARRQPELCAGESDFIGKILSDVYRHFGIAPPAVKPQNLPYPTLGALFKGRGAFLAQIETATAAGQGGASIIRARQAIHGMGGVGKTRVAVEYAWAHAGAYSALLFITADSPEALGRNVAALAGPLVLNLPEQAERETATQAAAVLRWLNAHPGWLLIVDNVDTEDAQQAVVDLLPRVPDGHVLVTSRLADWPAGIVALDLDVLSTESSIAFLMERTDDRRSRRADDADVANTIASLVDRLALALEQCAAYVRHRRCSLADYVADFERKRPAVLTWHDAAKSLYPVGVAVTYDASVAQLTDGARVLLQVLSWLAPEPLPAWTIEELSAVPDPRASLIELTDLHLARLSADGTVITVHRLLQEITRQQQRDAYPPGLAAALDWINAQYPLDAEDVLSWPLATPLTPHAVAVAAFASERGNRRLSAALFNQVSLFFSAKAGYVESEACVRRALELNDGDGGDPFAVAANLNNLADILRKTDRLAEAERLLRRAVDIAQDVFDPADSELATYLNNLGSFLLGTDRHEEAEPLLRRALAIDEAKLSPAHPTLAGRLDNVAKALLAKGNIDEAEPLMRRALAIDEATRANHPKVAVRLNNLGELLKKSKRFAEAEPLLRRALEIDEQAYGASHPEVATDLSNLGGLLYLTNQSVEAEAMIRRALAIQETYFGATHPQVGGSLANLATLLQGTGRVDQAEPLLRRALDILLASSKSARRPIPRLEDVTAQYWALLAAAGKSDAEITATILALAERHGLRSA